ncbi:ricin-type beta-trefoil lectin domain protein [Kitasatospora sp. NPDC049285]|uniref:ricin-type beta-trefoil lectin domain protein n=1 Tax=Kitasatospora sp. NPDC049285 TaxID=3157096 RepID=UPI0034337E74
MRRRIGRGALPLLAVAALLLGSTASAAPAAVEAAGPWVTFSGGHLSYGSDGQGNRVPDYSYAGYAGGGVALPQVATGVTAPAPSGGDDTAALQAAINQAAALPLDAQGFRGAVQLRAGQYRLAGTLSITASGVVLRGASADSTATSLVATGATARTLVTVGGSASYTVQGAQQQVTDAYVPVGARQLTLGSTTGLAVGDQVVVERPTTQAWIDALGMTGLWSPNWSLRSERRITAVSGNKVTLDVPLTTALEKQYTQALVYEYTYPRINHVGIENLSSDGQAMTADPNYASSFYNSSFSEFNAVEDGWVQNVFTHHFGQDGVTGLGPESRRISVLHTGALDMVVNDATSARSDGYTLQGQQNLVKDCTLTATKVHAFETEARQSGPNVFSDCTATVLPGGVTYDSGGHQRWGGGTLYDNVSLEGSLNMTDYGSQGTGHGWADANSTAWNCTTQSYLVKSPPTAHNWAIGCTGTVTSGSDGELQSAGANVLPRSLYDQQLADRLGTGVPADDFSLSASPTTGSVQQGGTATAALTTAVTSGNPQQLTLTTSGAPADVTLTLNPATVTTGNGSTLTATTAPTTAPGSYPITVTATGPTGTHTSVYTLTVTTTGGGTCTATQLLTNPGFENTTPTWTQTSTLGFQPITTATTAEPAHTGSKIAWFNGNSTPDTDTIAQTATLPAGCTTTLTYWLHVDTTENTTTATPDTLKAQLLDTNSTVITTLATHTNLDKNTGYTKHTADLTPYAGRTVTLKFTGTETDTNGGTTNFTLDDTTLDVTGTAPPPPASTTYVSAASGRCLGDANASSPSGTSQVIWDCVGSADQQWSYNAATKELKSGGRCLDVVGAATAAGTKVDVYTCNGHTNQQWTLGADGSIVGIASTLCLDVIGNKTVNGTGVEIWTCNGHTNQQWTAT